MQVSSRGVVDLLNRRSGQANYSGVVDDTARYVLLMLLVDGWVLLEVCTALA